MADQDPSNPSHAAFDSFVEAQSCKDVQRYFSELCRHLEVDPTDYRGFYAKLKERLNHWKAKALWVKLDKRAAHPVYQQGKVCAKTKCLVLGGGPCGLRTAIELALLGAEVVLLEKRKSFCRNNVLHLWPYTIYDLRSLSAKKFYGKFCTGTLDHISIRQLQLILLKVCLLLGVQVHMGVEFKGLLEPPASRDAGWMAKLVHESESHPAETFQFDVFISAGGGRFVPDGFTRKELRGKLAIGITANFLNRHTAAEAQVAEISGVARIYNQRFFQDLLTETGIDLENIVYYKDDTHYFVMTAKKKSLLKKGVIKQDYGDAEQLLAPSNVDEEALRRYAHDAAGFSTGHMLPDLEFVQNHAGQPDVAMFDFTSMHRAENASLVRERRGKKLLMGLVGDCLVEPFWPLGTGIARGFLAAFDTAWMVRSWALGNKPLDVLAERESIYQLLSQTTPENIGRNYSAFSIDPTTRYQSINLTSIKASQVQHLYNVEDPRKSGQLSKKQNSREFITRQESSGYEELLSWCQVHTAGDKRVRVKDLTQSWRSGLALCALIHHFRPHLIDLSSLDEANIIHNNQLAFSLLESELGITPVMSARDMATRGQIDKLSMVLYLSQVHEAFSKRPPPKEPHGPLLTPYKRSSLSRTQAAVFFLSKLKLNSLQRRKEKLAAKRGLEEREMGDEEEPAVVIPAPEVKPRPEPDPDPDPDPRPGSEQSPGPLGGAMPAGSGQGCYFCGQRVYVLERISAEGKFFHRSCFTCHLCSRTLRLGGYAFSQTTGRFYCELHSEDPELGNGAEPGSTQGVCGDGEEAENGLSIEKHTPPPSDEELEHTLDSAFWLPSENSEEPRTSGQNSDQQGTPDGEPQGSRPKPSQPIPDSDPQRRLRPGGDDKGGGVSWAEPPTELRPVPAPRPSRNPRPSPPQPRPPVPKPRTVHLFPPESPSISPHPEEHVTSDAGPRAGPPGAAHHPDSRPKQSLRKLQLSTEEKDRLRNLSFSLDSDSETHGGGSSSSGSSSGPARPAPQDGQEEEGYWGGGGGGDWAGHDREHRNRRCFRRKEEPSGQNQPARVRSKFSPWNLSSPKLGRGQRLSVHVHRPGTPETTVTYRHKVSEEDHPDGDDDDEDEDDLFGLDDIDLFDEKSVPADPQEAESLDLTKMRTLERRAKMSAMQRFTKAQSIQRRLEEIEVTFKELEEKGVELERDLRGEAGGGGSPELIEQWIQLVHQKNALVTEESDLMVGCRQLELEDKQSMLEMELRKHMEIDDCEKTAEQRVEEERALQQLLGVVDMRNSLVAFLEERRLQELSDEQHTVTLMEAKRRSATGAQVHWA